MAKATEKEINKMMEALGISREEAISVLAFDNDEVDNEEVNKIEEKAKDTAPAKKPTKKGSSLDKVKNQKAKKKADEVKEGIVKIIKSAIACAPTYFIKPQDLTSSKITFKATDGSYYSISITKHKAKPDGYED